jgi:hypothetical protein
MTWSRDELRKITEADDLHIAPFREDGVTYGTPTWIWSVPVDGDLYVRAFNGQQSRWYQAAMRQKAGQIRAAGIVKEVTFEPVNGPINGRIDDAYRTQICEQPASGMGLATARAFAVAGASVVLSDINEESLCAATQALTSAGRPIQSSRRVELHEVRAASIADAVLWLCSPGSTFVIGHALCVDGGYTAR